MEKLSMGGYGVYVWGSFALAFIVLAWNEWRARRAWRQTFREVEVRIRALEEQE
jgi:heme exporter protein CcmD